MVKRDNKNNESTKKLKPFIAPGSNIKVTNEEIEKRKKMVASAEEIGQRITKVDNDTENEGYENPYRAKALCYIARNMEVPEELKLKIKEFDKEHKKRVSNTNK